ncbi:MAG: DNA mismatch repair endonuclease MutL [Myxococcales bacterium]|nr:DNA mismatch repair endonuclease MutL [Myxococcales bacterium]
MDAPRPDERRRIERLSEHVANQIAAGEVVARPASVVKELLENALDAGARACRVEIEGGGVALVRVIDDGIGMDRVDARACLERHATNKLIGVEDLTTLRSFGFRGEALPSIASVSQFTLMTRHASEDEGTRVKLGADGAWEVEPWGGARGTIVEVAELFYCVPARRKFLRALATEAAHVTEVVREVALAHPSLQLELVRDGRVAKRWLRASDRAARVLDVLGEPCPVVAKEERGPIRVEAYLAAPERARPGATGLKLFVNGRPISDRGIARATAMGFGDALPPGRYPVGAVFIEISGALVDVNVHPQKAEVRFAQPAAVTGAVAGVIATSVARTFARTTPRTAFEPREARLPAAERDRGTWEFSRAQPSEPTAHRYPSPSPQAHELHEAEPVQHRYGQPHIAPVPRATSAHAFRWLGQLDDGVWLLTDARGVLFVSRHGAEARTLSGAARVEFEQRGHLVAQPLLFPVRIALTPARAMLSERFTDALERLGLELRLLGPEVATLQTTARVFMDAAPEQLFSLCLDELELNGGNPSTVVHAMSRLAAGHGPLPETEARDLAELWSSALEASDPRALPEVLETVAFDELRARNERAARRGGGI